MLSAEPLRRLNVGAAGSADSAGPTAKIPGVGHGLELADVDVALVAAACLPGRSSLQEFDPHKRRLNKRCAHRPGSAPDSNRSDFRRSERLCGQGRGRTADLPLFRRMRTVSECRQSWPDVAFSWDNRLPRSPHVVGRLPVLAPLLAPRADDTAASGYKTVAPRLVPRACASVTRQPSRLGSPLALAARMPVTRVVA